MPDVMTEVRMSGRPAGTQILIYVEDARYRLIALKETCDAGSAHRFCATEGFRIVGTDDQSVSLFISVERFSFIVEQTISVGKPFRAAIVDKDGKFVASLSGQNVTRISVV